MINVGSSCQANEGKQVEEQQIEEQQVEDGNDVEEVQNVEEQRPLANFVDQLPLDLLKNSQALQISRSTSCIKLLLLKYLFRL